MAGSLMDYDGDGDAEEGVGEEMAGLQEKLLAAITAYGKEVAKADIGYDAVTYPYFFARQERQRQAGRRREGLQRLDPRLLRAAYNYQVATKDPGAFAHNAKYIIQLQHDSIADLNTKLAKPVDIEKAARNDVGHFDGTTRRSAIGTKRAWCLLAAPSAIGRRSASVPEERWHGGFGRLVGRDDRCRGSANPPTASPASPATIRRPSLPCTRSPACRSRAARASPSAPRRMTRAT